jgi:hypothetical protein
MRCAKAIMMHYINNASPFLLIQSYRASESGGVFILFPGKSTSAEFTEGETLQFNSETKNSFPHVS